MKAAPKAHMLPSMLQNMEILVLKFKLREDF